MTPSQTQLQATLQNRLGGRYILRHELGHGAMATVFLADRAEGGPPVAVKALHPEVAMVLGPGRFRREIDILRTLDHPGIVPVLEAGDTWFVMPFLEGETLRALLKREERLPLPRVREIAAEVAAAIDHAHRNSIIHRDIKPENVILTGGHAVVCDFGLARAVAAAGGERISSSGLVVGTPGYMSPEQAAGEREVSYRADIYSFGSVLYEMITGEPPYSGASRQAVFARQLAEAPRSMRVIRPEVPERVERAVLAALARHPGDRPANALALVEAISPG